MTEEKLKIMEKLWDLVDKELKFGCMVVMMCNMINISCLWWEISEDEGFSPLKFIYIDKYNYYSERNWVEYIDEMSWDWAEPILDEILWQYHLWTILRWFENKRYWILFNNKKINIAKWNNEIELPIDKPPMERSEEEDKKLLEFMDSVE